MSACNGCCLAPRVEPHFCKTHTPRCLRSLRSTSCRKRPGSLTTQASSASTASLETKSSRRLPNDDTCSAAAEGTAEKPESKDQKPHGVCFGTRVPPAPRRIGLLGKVVISRPTGSLRHAPDEATPLDFPDESVTHTAAPSLRRAQNPAPQKPSANNTTSSGPSLDQSRCVAQAAPLAGMALQAALDPGQRHPAHLGASAGPPRELNRSGPRLGNITNRSQSARRHTSHKGMYCAWAGRCQLRAGVAR